MPRLKWFSKLISKPGRPGPSTSPSGQGDIIGNDWLGNAIQVANLAVAAGELAPFPYIKGAALIFQAVLTPIQVRPFDLYRVILYKLCKQQFKQNRGDFKALTTSITYVLSILHEVAKDHPDTAKNSPRFSTLSEEFNG